VTSKYTTKFQTGFDGRWDLKHAKFLHLGKRDICFESGVRVPRQCLFRALCECNGRLVWNSSMVGREELE